MAAVTIRPIRVAIIAVDPGQVIAAVITQAARAAIITEAIATNPSKLSLTPPVRHSPSFLAGVPVRR